MAGGRLPGRAGRHVLLPVLVRGILLLAWLLVTVNLATQARDATLADLAEDLSDGRVTSIQVERAAPGDRVQGSFGLRWHAGWFDSFTAYQYSLDAGVDEAGRLLDQAQTQGVPVHVVLAAQYPPGETVTREGLLVTALGPWVTIVGVLILAASLAVLITSPRPWLATKWAWFWLVWAMPVLWLAFLALEPRPLQHSLRLARVGRVPSPLLEDRDRRLTGGWALLLAWVLSALLAAAGLPMFSTWQ